MKHLGSERRCWCGGEPWFFNAEYGRCVDCGTLVSKAGLSGRELQVADDEVDFYGKQYWLDHQSRDLGFPDIRKRARADLTDRNLHWLQSLLRYRLPPAKVLELGCSHGSFVKLLRQAGYDATGIEMSPWVVEFGRAAFNVPVLVGPVENLDIPKESCDIIALMDVLEHLDCPKATMEHCLTLLKPDGLLLVQTPQFRKEMTYEDLMRTNGAFLGMLRADEHLYLFTEQSVSRLFEDLNCRSIEFMPAIFGQYDMFFVVSRQAIERVSKEKAEGAMMATPEGRLVLALLDMHERIRFLEADGADRLEQIYTLTGMVHELRGVRYNRR